MRKAILITFAVSVLCLGFLACKSDEGVTTSKSVDRVLANGIWGYVTHAGDGSPCVGCVEVTAYCETCGQQVGDATGTGSGGYYGIYGDSFVAHDGHEFHMKWDHNVGGVHTPGNCHAPTFTYSGDMRHDFTVPGRSH